MKLIINLSIAHLQIKLNLYVMRFVAPQIAND